MPPQTHIALSPLPLARHATVVIGEEAGSSQISRRTPRETHHTAKLKQWPRMGRKFWIHESPSSWSSQDGSSNTSSGGHSTGSEGSEERCVRTVSPYGSFFVEEMEFDTPTENSSLYRGDRQEHTTVFMDRSGVIHPTQKLPSNRTSSQVPMAPVHSTTGYPTYTRPPGGMAAQDHGAATAVEISPLFLAENSRRSQPPISWHQEYLDHTNSPHWDNSRSLSGHNTSKRQMRGIAPTHERRLR
ncbi:hypothetical protein BJV74DRAFT_609556 [Russula compacta]|nr:hypothetical protein BJV74DRAFT_609556 [Russula compacta]